MINIDFWKWWTVFIVGCIAIGSGGYFFDLFNYLNAVDLTKISFAIIAIALATSASIGFRWNATQHRETTFQWFVADGMLSLGMVGTLIGFMLILGQVFVSVDINNQATVVAAIENLAVGMSTALVTTLVGLICSLWVKLQLTVAEM